MASPPLSATPGARVTGSGMRTSVAGTHTGLRELEARVDDDALQQLSEIGAGRASHMDGLYALRERTPQADLHLLQRLAAH